MEHITPTWRIITLTDGSRVYNVRLGPVEISCVDKEAALKLLEVLVSSDIVGITQL